ncbi:MAG: hypothetical protein M3081_17080 [Gemmatimonadota bacterium]|nr:hypothetical protein [Gemmatimonadota bacterium]
MKSLHRRPVHVARFIAASELGEYAYCRRAWWLRAVRGASSEEQSARFRHGHAEHWRHGWTILVARALIVLSLALVLVALSLLAWRSL